MNQENAVVNYPMALKNYNQNGRGRSMRKFCEDEGYDYNKFMQCARKGQKELSILQGDTCKLPGIVFLLNGKFKGIFAVCNTFEPCHKNCR
ncbi:MAG: hypothetical protein ACI4UJ_06240 [Candidatus Cryptobacteroides sp.]